MDRCAKCGICSTVCPVFRVSGRESDTARGKLHLLVKLADAPHSPAYREILSRCLLCGACRSACPCGLDLPALVAEARADFPRLTGSGAFVKWLATSCLAHQDVLAGLAGTLRLSGPLLRRLPPESGLRLKLGLFLESPEPGRNRAGQAPQATPAHQPAPGAVAIFSGCLARYLQPEIGAAVSTLIDPDGRTLAHTPKDQTCCGLASFSAGNPEEARRLARRNLDAFAASDGPIVTPCGSCYHHLKAYPELLAADREYRPRAAAFAARLRELSEFLVEAREPDVSPAGPARETPRVFYHDPCHLRFSPRLREAPRRLLRARPGLELVELPGGPRCCGLGGTFNLAFPEVSHQIGAALAEEIVALAPDLVVTSCSGCLLQLHYELARLAPGTRVLSLAEFLVRS